MLQRLQVRILIVALAGVVAMTIAVVILGATSTQRSLVSIRKAEGAESLKLAVDNMSGVLDRTLKSLHVASQHPVVSDPKIQSGLRQAALRQVVLESNGVIRSLAVHGRDNSVISTNDPPPEPLPSATRRMQTSYLQYRIAAEDDEPAVKIFAPFKNQAGDTTGEVLEARIPLRRFLEPIQVGIESGGPTLVLMDGRGQILAHVEPSLMGTRFALEGDVVYGKEGESFYAVVQSLKTTVPAFDEAWRLALLIPRDAILTASSRSVSSLLTIGLLCIGISAYLGWTLTKTVSAQFDRVQEGVAEIETGDFEARIEEKGALAEFLSIIYRLNRLTQKIGSHKAAADTARKQSEKDANEAKVWATQISQELEATMQSSNDGLLMLTPDGKAIGGLNRRFLEFSGLASEDHTSIEPAQIIQRLAWQFQETESFLEWWEACQKAPDCGEVRDWKLRQPDDGVAQLRLSSIRNADNETIGVLWRVWDRTAAARIERKAEGVEKAELVGNLASGLGHEFNRIVTSVVANLSQLDSDASPEVRHQIVTHAKEAANHAASMSRGLLGYSQANLLDVKLNTVQSLLRGVESRVESFVGSNVDFQIEYPDERCHVAADSEKLRTVLVELCSNALAAMPDGGTVKLSAEATTFGSDELNPDDLEAGHYVCFKVEDTGTGIPAAAQERIFEPFFTTRERSNGLGLAAVSGIVWQHGGWIDYRTDEGKGTCFRVFLPASELPVTVVVEGESAEVVDAKKVDSIQQAASQVSVPNGSFVLVIDDEDNVRRLTQAILKRGGNQTYGARNGFEALEMVRQYHAQVSLVILDLNMPEMDGREFFKILRNEFPLMPVIVVSGYLLDFNAFEDMDCSVPPAAFVQKPYQADQFLNQVASITSQKAA